MSILVDEKTKAVIQGITGREASEKVPEMIDYGTEVLAGVTPGKSGEEVAGVPVYDTVSEALEAEPDINASLVYVPPFAAKDAAFEALENGIELVCIVTERIPVRDAWKIKRRADERNARIVGPSSLGVLTPGECKLGPIGGSKPGEAYDSGRIGIISKSGGMTTETAWTLKQSGFGVSTAVAIGGDVISGTTYEDALKMFEEDEETDGVVMYGELGGTYEDRAAELIESGGFSKPLVAFIAGEFTEDLPSTNYGHAGAIIRGDRGLPSSKKKKLREAGASVVDRHHKIPEALEESL
ncbi:MAG: CoA-binding protein [Candidatus Nanohaloarchaea archaeon]